MRFLMMLCDLESGQLKPGDAGFEQRMGEYLAFDEKVKKLGVWRDSGKLHPTGAAKTVRIRDGQVIQTDGPFAETKEQLGGFYILECRDLDHALELAREIPTAKHGLVEVRPILF